MNRISSHYFLLLLLFLLISCSQNRQKVIVNSESRKAFSFYYNALDHIETGQFKSALSDLDSAIHYQPEYSNYYFVKGRVYEFLEKPDSAIKAYEHSVELKSYYPDAWIRLADLYLSQWNFAGAAANYKKAVQHYPDSSRFYLRLGECYFRLEKYYLALDRLRDYQSRSENPSIELKKWQGMAHYGLEAYQKAAELLQSYAQKNPYDSEALKYLGMAQFKLGEYNLAISALNKAIVSNKADPEIYLYRARYFMLQDKMDVAQEQLNVGLKQDSLNSDILFELGLFYFNQNKFDSSKYYFNKVTDTDPDYWRAYRYLGFIAEHEKNLEEALANYKLFLENTFEDDAEVSRRISDIQNKIQIKNN